MSKISWSKALADYLKDETESYASIARKDSVSYAELIKFKNGNSSGHNKTGKGVLL